MENTIESKKRLLGTLADDERTIVDTLEQVSIQGAILFVSLFCLVPRQQSHITFNMENEIEAAKYYTLISFFNSEAINENGRFLELYSEKKLGLHLTDSKEVVFWYNYM